MLKLAEKSGDEPYLILLAQRTIPSDIVECNPTQRLFRGRTRTVLTAMGDLSKRSDEIKFHLRQRRNSTKRYHDCDAKNLSELKEGKEVWVHDIPEKPQIRRNYRVLREQGTRGGIEQRNESQKQTTHPRTKCRQCCYRWFRHSGPCHTS